MIALEVAIRKGEKWRFPHECGNHRYERIAVGRKYAPNLQLARQKKPSGSADEVTAPHRNDPEQFPVFQLVFFRQRGSGGNRRFFGTVV